MQETTSKIYYPFNRSLALKVTYGHFATNHSHINYYIDMTMLKTRQLEAMATATAMAREYMTTTIVDTIVCMDGCEVIGAYLAEQLSSAGIMSMNTHKTIYIISPEYNLSNQMIFRDNTQPMVKNKHVLLLLASATTGKTIARALECITYYGGRIAGISAIFSAVDQINSIPVHSVFQANDLNQYETYEPHNCPLCKNGTPIEAMVNSFGYSRLN